MPPTTTRPKNRNRKKNSLSSISSPVAAADSCDDDVPIISNSDVDNALLNFDTAASNSMMGSGHDDNHDRNHLMPKMNFESSSLGTRSPSASDLSDASSVGSKRSRTEMKDDGDVEGNNRNNTANKRAAVPTSAPGSAPIDFRQANGAHERGRSPAEMIRMDRVREGRCPDCGLETHSMVRRNDGSFAREPLNIDGEVLNGRCLFCNPLDDVESDTSSQQFINNVQHSGLSPITSSKHWPSGHNRGKSPIPRKQSPVDHTKLMSSRNSPTDMHQNNNKTSPLTKLWEHRRVEGGLSVSSVSCSDGLDTVDSQSVLTDDGDDDRSHRSGNSEGMGKLGNAVTAGMGMSGGGRRTPQQQFHQRSRAPDPPTLKSIPNTSPKPLDTPISMNSRAIVRRNSSGEGVQRDVVTAHSKLPSSIYHHHQYPMDNAAERAFIEKTRSYLESGSGDICDVIAAMRRFPFSLSIQRVACEKLHVHCCERDYAHAIGLSGGIRTIIDAMDHHPDDVLLQHTCAGMIRHLACASPYNLDMLDRMGAVEKVIATMERHSQNAMLLEASCWAIEGMARFHSLEFKMRVARGGGIHAAMKAVETFPDNDGLLRAAFHCLRQLGYNPSSFVNQQQQQTGGIPQSISMTNGN